MQLITFKGCISGLETWPIFSWGEPQCSPWLDDARVVIANDDALGCAVTL
jgi:hypothetical protein